MNLEAHGVSQELRTLAASLTQRTFLDFPLAELEGEAKRAWRVRIWWRDGLPRAVRVEEFIGRLAPCSALPLCWRPHRPVRRRRFLTHAGA